MGAMKSFFSSTRDAMLSTCIYSVIIGDDTVPNAKMMERHAAVDGYKNAKVAGYFLGKFLRYQIPLFTLYTYMFKEQAALDKLYRKDIEVFSLRRDSNPEKFDRLRSIRKQDIGHKIAEVAVRVAGLKVSMSKVAIGLIGMFNITNTVRDDSKVNLTMVPSVQEENAKGSFLTDNAKTVLWNELYDTYVCNGKDVSSLNQQVKNLPSQPSPLCKMLQSTY